MLCAGKVSSQPHGAISLWKSLRPAHVSLQITVLGEAGLGFCCFPPFLLVIPAVPGAAELGSALVGSSSAKAPWLWWCSLVTLMVGAVNCHNETLN